jgi:predicted dehydrogenase
MKLGIIGLSEGNGHPYSWTAICNGYSPEFMKACEFPVIPKYLEEQDWPSARITGVSVTHIWTQNIELSRRIARASLIPHVVSEPAEMLDEIDALLLARDDAERHYDFVAPFIRAGIPVYIDKPIALSLKVMRSLYQMQRYEGQIYTCSALRYAKELMLSQNDIDHIGPIKHIQAVTPKSWEKYAIHIIEPSLKMIGAPIDLDSAEPRCLAGGGRAVSIRFQNGVTADFSAVGEFAKAPLSIRVYGERSWKDFIFTDAFSAFKLALTDFLEGVKTKSCRSPIEFNQQVVSILELGLRK